MLLCHLYMQNNSFWCVETPPTTKKNHFFFTRNSKEKRLYAYLPTHFKYCDSGKTNKNKNTHNENENWKLIRGLTVNWKLWLRNLFQSTIDLCKPFWTTTFDLKFTDWLKSYLNLYYHTDFKLIKTHSQPQL